MRKRTDWEARWDRIYEKKRMILLPFSLVMIAYLIWRLLTIAPQFFPAFATVVVLTLILALGYRVTRRTLAMKCVSCGNAMMDMGIRKVYGGARTADGKKLDSLGIRVYRCEGCSTEYHELVYALSATGDAVDHRTEAMMMESMLHVIKSEIPGGRTTLDMKEDSAENYQQIKRSLADAVIMHNQRNGFVGDPIKIDLERL